MCVYFLGTFENINFHAYTAVVTFWANFVNFGLIYISASGHTAYDSRWFSSQWSIL